MINKIVFLQSHSWLQLRRIFGENTRAVSAFTMFTRLPIILHILKIALNQQPASSSPSDGFGFVSRLLGSKNEFSWRGFRNYRNNVSIGEFNETRNYTRRGEDMPSWPRS